MGERREGAGRKVRSGRAHRVPPGDDLGVRLAEHAGGSAGFAAVAPGRDLDAGDAGSCDPRTGATPTTAGSSSLPG